METLESPDSSPTEIVDLEVSPPQETLAPADGAFAVGDFVWAKTKGQPWWPALVSDSSGPGGDSQKVPRNRHSVLVAFFGDDEAVVWCEPKQLKPFFRVFEEMAGQSRSKGFLGALGNAMGEVEMCLQMEMSCHCVPVDSRRSSLRRISGGKLPISSYSPGDFLRLVQAAAMDVRVVNLLDAVRLRNWAIAFEKGFLQGESWVFNRRHGIEDLVDKIDLDAPDPELVNGKEEEQAPAENHHEERKRGDMAKLIAETDLDAVEIDDEEGEEEKGMGSSMPNKKRNFDLVKVKEEAGSVLGRRERKKSKYLSPPYTNLGEESKGFGSLQKGLEEKILKRAARLSHSAHVGSSAILRCSSEEDESQSSWLKIGQTAVHDIFSEFVSIAENPVHLKWIRGAKIVRWFFAMYRSSIFSGGAEFEDYKKMVKEYIAENVEGTDQEEKLDSKSAMYVKQNDDPSEKKKPGKKKMPAGETIQRASVDSDIFVAKPLEDGERKQKALIESVHSDIPMEVASNEGTKKQTPRKKKKMSKDETSSNAPVCLDKIHASDEIKLGQTKKRRRNASKIKEAKDMNLETPSEIRERFSKVVVDPESIDTPEPKSFESSKIEMKDDINGKSLQNSGDRSARNPKEAKLGKSKKRRKNASKIEAAKDLNLRTPSEIKERFSKVAVDAESTNTPEPKSFDSTKIEMKNDINGKSLQNSADRSAGNHKEAKLWQSKKRRKNASKIEEAKDLNLQTPSEIRKRFSKVIVDAESTNTPEPKSFDSMKIEIKDDIHGKSLQNSGDRSARDPKEAKLRCKKKNGDGLQMAKSGRKRNKMVGASCGGQTALQLDFHSGIALPSMEDLITTYSKYGALVESKIELFKESNSARVVFARIADAENALNDKAGPYGSIATYRLHNLPSNELLSNSQLKQDSKTSTPKPPLPFIRRSLETMISTLCWPPSSSLMVSNSGPPSSDELKPEARDNLVGEMQGLLQKVDKMLNGGEKSSNSFT